MVVTCRVCGACAAWETNNKGDNAATLGQGLKGSHKTLTLESSDCDLSLQNHLLAFLLFLLSSPLFR